MAAGKGLEALQRLLDAVRMLEVSWFTLLVAVTAVHILYYSLFVVRKPKVITPKQGQLFSALREHCPILFESYWPTPWGYNTHITSIFRAKFQRGVDVKYTRDMVTLHDGGVVALDWACLPSGASQSDWPILLIMPGLTGESTHNYILHLVADGMEQCFRPVVFNQRGNGGIPMKTPRTYCATDTQDLKDVITYIHKEMPSASVMAVGVSLGGVILTKYLHDYGRGCGIVGVVIVSTVFDPMATRSSMNSFLNWHLYNRFMVGKLKTLMLRQKDLFAGEDLDITMDSIHQMCLLARGSPADRPVANDYITLSYGLTATYVDDYKVAFYRVNTVEDFDRSVTIKIFNYSSVEEYYRDANNTERIAGIRTPLIAMNAADDPISPEHALPIQEFAKNPYTALVVTRRGGHFGFLEGLFPVGPTWMDRAFQQSLIALKSLHDHQH